MEQELFVPPQLSADPGAERAAQRLVYAIGDIHGRIDLLERLYAALKADAASLVEGPPVLVFLGDYVDRGPDSDRVIDFVLAIPSSEFEVVPLLGNHEAAMLGFLDNPQWGPDWSHHGGRETLLSYGVDVAADDLDWRQAAEALATAVPMEHLSFLYSLRHTYEAGGYFFCHAGVHPDRALDDQDPEDLLWIREPFLSCTTPLDKVIVHGHTVAKSVHSDAVRIGLDTGAYRTGRLSAVRLDGSGRRVFFSATLDGVATRSEDRPPPPARPKAPGRQPDSNPVAQRLEAFGQRILRLAGRPWPPEAHAQALRALGALEARLEGLAALGEAPHGPDSVHSAPDAVPPAPPADTEEIVRWLKSLGISLSIVLGPHLSALALSAARAGDLGTALSLIEEIAPASVRRAWRDLHSSSDKRALVTRFLEQAGPAQQDNSRLSDDLLRLILFLRAARGE